MHCVAEYVLFKGVVYYTMKRYLYLAGLLLLCLTQAAFPLDKEKTKKRIIKKFDSIDNFSAEFQQDFHWKVLDKHQQREGTMVMAKPDRFFIEMEEMTIVCDGKQVWRYVPENKQAILSPLKRSPEIPSINRFVFNFGKNYTIEALQEKGKHYILHLTPHIEGMSINNLKIWVDKKELLLRKINYSDDNQNENTYTLKHLKINQPVEQSQFTFTVPDGVELFKTD
jgi:outer membrane lipoprotein carrier protein